MPDPGDARQIAATSRRRRGRRFASRGCRWVAAIRAGVSAQARIRSMLLPRRLLRRVLHFFRFGVDSLDRGSRVIRQMISRIPVHKILKRRPRFLRIVQVVLVNLPNREQGIETIFAAGIFLAQKAILINRAPQNFVVVKAPPHLDHQFGSRHHARVRLRRCRRAEVNATVRLDHPLVFVPGAFSQRTPVESFAHAFRFSELLARPTVVVMDSG